jgi:hypothetical protein
VQFQLIMAANPCPADWRNAGRDLPLLADTVAPLREVDLASDS